MTDEFDSRVWPTRITHEFDPRTGPKNFNHENKPQEDRREWPLSLTQQIDPREWATRPIQTTWFSTHDFNNITFEFNVFSQENVPSHFQLLLIIKYAEKIIWNI